MPLRSRWSRALASVLLALAAAALPACEDETPVKKGPSVPIDPGEQARIDQGKKLLREANDAIVERKYDRARKLLGQASALGNESQRFDIEEAQEKLDKREAKAWANDVEDAFKNNDCKGAFQQLAMPLKTLADSEAFTRELRRLVGEDTLKCVQGMIDAKIGAGAFADARNVVANPEVVTVLGERAVKQLAAQIEATISDALRARIDGDVRARHWDKVVEKIDAAQKKGEATDAQTEALLGVVRAGVLPELTALATRAVGKRDAPAALAEIDKMARLVRWAIVDPSAPVVQMGGTMPEDLAAKRANLAIWVEAARLKMRPLTKPEVRWTLGKVALSPPASADAPSKGDLPHGKQIWILGATRDRALVTTTDPAGAKLTDLLGKVAGWVPSHRLVRENSIDWLLPDEQLKGQRVWGPLRGPDAMWELGVVVNVSGKDVLVQRLADGVNVKLTRQKLRSGRLSPGTRVITFCVAKDQPAQVVAVTPAGRTAKLKCDGGQEKEEDLASLRSKPENLPPTK